MNTQNHFFFIHVCDPYILKILDVQISKIGLGCTIVMGASTLILFESWKDGPMTTKMNFKIPTPIIFPGCDY